mgnify:CR=1 FL=1
MKRLLMAAFVLLVVGISLSGPLSLSIARADGYIDFENGIEGEVIRSTIPGLQFTTTAGQDWIYGDWRTGNYNGPYPSGSYISNGNFFAWLGPNQGAGRIDFTEGCATYIQAYVSTYSGLTVDAYYSDDRLAGTASVGHNLDTGQMTRLRVDAIPGDCFHYVIFHDSGNYWLIDDLSTDAAGVPATRPPVIVLPGLMGSRLDAYNSCDGEGSDDAVEAWLAVGELLGGDDHLDVLRLATGGRDPLSSCDQVFVPRITNDRFENGAITSVKYLTFTKEFYTNLFSRLRLKGFTVYGYGFDWRHDLRTSASRSGGDNDLDDFIDQVLAETGATQVNLVGHSLGGLLARQYVTSDPAHAAKVEQVITLGTPYLGAPKSLKALRWGDSLTDFPVNIFLAVGEEKAKELIANAPAFYQILPSRRYYDVSGSFFVSGGRPLTWTQSDMIIRSQQNSALAMDANAFHTPAMDDWDSFTSNVAFRLIVGTGMHDTPGMLRETIDYDFFGRPYLKMLPMGVINGDGTVPLPSASLQGRGINYRGDAAIWYTRGLDHGGLANEPYVVDFVGSLLSTPPAFNITRAAKESAIVPGPDAPPLYTGPVGRFSAPRHADNTPPPPPEMSTDPFPVSGGLITAVGEVQLHVYDDQGRHTGFVAPNTYEAGIPDSSYMRLGDTISVAVPTGSTYRIEVVSAGTALFDLRFQNLEGIEGNLVQRAISYTDVPLGEEGAATADFIPLNTGPAPSMNIDTDGDGQQDETIPPTGDVGPIGASDLTDPVVTITLDGVTDEVGNYIGVVVASLSATDEGSGVAKLVYTLDENGLAQEYTGPFPVNADLVDTILAHAIDFAGNKGWAFADLEPAEQAFLSVILGK